jgi:predicted solute-binding protein
MVNGVEVEPVSRPLNLGWIPYWNLYPFERELLRRKPGEFALKAGHPVKVNGWLGDGSVDVAPCSSINLLKNPKAEIAINAGVSSRGAVQSVYLGFHSDQMQVYELLRERREQAREWFSHIRQANGFDVRKIAQGVHRAAGARSPVSLSQAPRLKLSSASETSAKLAQVLYRLWFGKDAYEINCEREISAAAPFGPKSQIELVIGDEALVRRRSFHRIIDLGAVWFEMTGLPFVFAVWQTVGNGLNCWRKVLQETAELAEARMKVEPAAYLPDPLPLDEGGKPIRLPEYWKAINYKLGAEEFKGLALYLALAREFSPGKYSDSSIAKMLRWQELGIKGHFEVL